MADLSASGVTTYMDCEQKYFFTRVERWEYDGLVKPGAMELGSLLHYLVERWVKGDALDDMHSLAESWIFQTYASEYSIADAMKNHMGYALSMIRYVVAWIEHNKFFDKWEPIEVEEALVAEIGGHTFRATPDVILMHRITKGLGILDYKTSANLNVHLHARDWQLAVIAAILDQLGRVPYYGMHLRIKKAKANHAKPPFVELKEIRFSEERLALIKAELIEIGDRVDANQMFLPNPSSRCESMCAYSDACEAKGSGQDWVYVLSQTHKRKEDTA